MDQRPQQRSPHQKQLTNTTGLKPLDKFRGDDSLNAQIWVVSRVNNILPGQEMKPVWLAEPIHVVSVIALGTGSQRPNGEPRLPMYGAHPPFLRTARCSAADDVAQIATAHLERLLDNFDEQFVPRFIERVSTQKSLHVRWE